MNGNEKNTETGKYADLEAKVRSLASLQLYAMEQDSEARRAMEKALIENSIRQSREIAFWQVATLTGLLLAVATLLSGPLFFVGMVVYVVLAWRCIATMSGSTSAVASAMAKIDAAREAVDETKKKTAEMAKPE